jgi:fused signal recognition particle receptor
MDPGVAINPADLYEMLAVVGGLVGTGLLGFFVVRRARAARRRQIDEAGEPRPRELPRRRAAAPEPQDKQDKQDEQDDQFEDRSEDETVPDERIPASDVGAGAARPPEPQASAVPSRAHQAPGPARAPTLAAVPVGQVLPFRVPTTSIEKPTLPSAPAPAGRRKKDTAALAPGLARTRSTGFIAGLGALFAGRKELDPSIVGELEKLLLTADIGVRTSEKLLEEIRTSLSRKELANPDAIWAFLRKRSAEILAQDFAPVDFAAAKPFVLLTIGVNGSGKTTTIGKLAAKLHASGKSVMLAAGDTFRAAAAEQLEIWAGRTGATLVRGKEGADPSSVIFDAVRRGVAEGFDVVIADTAGRLHTKTDLMQELQKVRRVIDKASPGAPHETWLVIDATMGQNAIAQAQIFTKEMQVSGIVLAKLDGTAKGGVILGIADQLKLPVRYVGIGERVDDLREFDAEEFVEALFEPPALLQ